MYRLPSGPRARDEGGYVLVVVLIVLIAVSAIAMAAFRSTEAEVRIASNQYVSTQAGYAAEAGAEKLMADLYKEMADGILTPVEVAGIGGSPPHIPNYSFTDYGATMDASGVARPVTQGPLAGLESFSNDVRIRSSVEGPRNARATVELQVLAQAIPIFQFGVFYEYDLENCPGPNMEIGGRVHSNGDLYLDGIGRQRYWDMITSAGDLHLHPKASTNCSSEGLNNFVRMNDLSWTEMTSDTHAFGGDDIPGTFPTAAQDKAFDDHSKANWDHRVQTRASGMERLEVPIPEGIDPYALIEPCTGTEAASLAQAKYACNAGLTLRVNGGVLEALAGGMTKTLQNANAIRFVPNAFYDDREQSSNAGDAATGNNNNSNRDVIEIRIDLLRAAMGEYGGGVIYVTADSALAGGGYAPAHERQYAVRVSGGSQLEAPLTIATNLPLYVMGDYNTAAGAWQPASFASDAITVLSGSWSDAASGEGWTENPPLDTRVEAAILSGHTPTPFFGSPNGGGWLNNYPRFLERWSGGVTVTLLGSLVSLWFPRRATAPYYQPGSPFYSPPVRDWRFDTRFRTLWNLPPSTPVVGQVVKLGYTRRY